MIAKQNAALAVLPSNMSDECVVDLAAAFKLLGDETRLRMVLHIRRNEELNVSQLCELLHLAQPLVSHHLGLLREGGVLTVRPQGKHNFYHIRPGYFERLMKSLAPYNADQPLCERFLQCVFC
ncbi:MAG: metalloregulator ArsR/SmtB family transcription factor [Pirellulaceae bacterium]